MQVPPIKPNKPEPSFGILEGYRKTPDGNYMWGKYKGHKIEIFDYYKKYDQKLQYVSDGKTLKWIKSKLIYINNGIKKIIRSYAK